MVKHTKEYLAKQEEIKLGLQKFGFTVEGGHDGKPLVFSLTRIGLDCIYAEITSEEIQYQVDNE
jgi:hypothetical protein